MGYGQRLSDPAKCARPAARTSRSSPGSRQEFPSPLAESWPRFRALGISPGQHNPRPLHDPSEVLQPGRATPGGPTVIFRSGRLIRAGIGTKANSEALVTDQVNMFWAFHPPAAAAQSSQQLKPIRFREEIEFPC